MTVILGPDFARKRGLPSAKLSDVQPQPPHTRSPIGHRPWRRVVKDDNAAVVLDRDGNTICSIVTKEIAGLIESAVNSYAPLLAERSQLEDILRTAQAELHAGTADGVSRAREMIDGVLTP